MKRTTNQKMLHASMAKWSFLTGLSHHCMTHVIVSSMDRWVQWFSYFHSTWQNMFSCFHDHLLLTGKAPKISTPFDKINMSHIDFLSQFVKMYSSQIEAWNFCFCSLIFSFFQLLRFSSLSQKSLSSWEIKNYMNQDFHHTHIL